MIHGWLVISWCVIAFLAAPATAQPPEREDALKAMRTAAEFFRNQVASHGGYVYHYTIDLENRWGEGRASEDEIWVQPPGTPTVGMAYLEAFHATGDSFYREAAAEAGSALAYGQLKSGGWQNMISFDPQSPRVADYRNGRGGGKNYSSLDDDQTPSAIRLMIALDQAHQFQHEEFHEVAQTALTALLDAQFPNGGFPQVWDEPVGDQPVLAASYPDYDWRSEGRIKNYWDMYTLNDNVTGNVSKTLERAYRTYDDARYLKALAKLGDFLLLAQMPDPQPAWAQQYSYAMKPIWARKFEPPAIASDETQESLETLMSIAEVTGEEKYLEPIPRALQWLKRSRLEDGRLARYYELKTNRPLYMNRSGDRYTLTYDDTNLPSHYGWKINSRIDSLEARYQALVSGGPGPGAESIGQLRKEAQRIIDSLDPQGRWVSTYGGERLVGQAKIPVGTDYLSSQVFADNLRTLRRWVKSLERTSR